MLYTVYLVLDLGDAFVTLCRTFGEKDGDGTNTYPMGKRTVNNAPKLGRSSPYRRLFGNIRTYVLQVIGLLPLERLIFLTIFTIQDRHIHLDTANGIE
jgi:hypothetical protein